MSDAQEIFERYASDPDVTRFVGWPRHRTVADTEAFLGFCAHAWEHSPVGPYLIRARVDGRVLGGTGVMLEAPDRAMTGYVLAKDAWGMGYATEALRAMVDVARAVGVVWLSALCHPDHRASWRVLEKCHFVRDHEWQQPAEFPNFEPGVPHAVFCYARHLRGGHS